MRATSNFRSQVQPTLSLRVQTRRVRPCELCWCQVSQTAVRPLLVVVEAPLFNHPPSFGQAHEPVQVQALVAQSTIETLHECILQRSPGGMKESLTPCPYAHRSMALPTNSGPLSNTIESGLPRKSTSRSRIRTTRSPGRDESTSHARHSRLKSSTTLSTRNLDPDPS